MEHLRAIDQREQPTGTPRGAYLRTCAGRLMKFRGTIQIVAVLTLVAPGALLSQQKTAPPPVAAAKQGTGQIIGLVLDSLNGTYLSGAEVMIQGAKATVTTDSLGRFRVDSVPA